VSASTTSDDALHHHSRRMRGRDRHEAHRVATPLELLFDLTFVISGSRPRSWLMRWQKGITQWPCSALVSQAFRRHR
jgi:hypothetical protein